MLFQKIPVSLQLIFSFPVDELILNIVVQEALVHDCALFLGLHGEIFRNFGNQTDPLPALA